MEQTKKKKWLTVVLIIVGIGIAVELIYGLVMFFIDVSQTSTFLEIVANRYGIELSDTMEEVYRYHESGGFSGDSTHYYVYRVGLEELSVADEFASTRDSDKDAMTKAFTAYCQSVGTEYAFDWSHDCMSIVRRIYNDSLYLIYDKDLSRLIVMEIRM